MSDEASDGKTYLRSVAPDACEMCGYDVLKPTKHRVIPGREGGAYRKINVLFCCGNCHSECEHGLHSREYQFSLIAKRLGVEEIDPKMCVKREESE